MRHKVITALVLLVTAQTALAAKVTLEWRQPDIDKYPAGDLSWTVRYSDNDSGLWTLVRGIATPGTQMDIPAPVGAKLGFQVQACSEIDGGCSDFTATSYGDVTAVVRPAMPEDVTIIVK